MAGSGRNDVNENEREQTVNRTEIRVKSGLISTPTKPVDLSPDLQFGHVSRLLRTGISSNIQFYHQFSRRVTSFTTASWDVQFTAQESHHGLTAPRQGQLGQRWFPVSSSLCDRRYGAVATLGIDLRESRKVHSTLRKSPLTLSDCLLTGNPSCKFLLEFDRHCFMRQLEAPCELRDVSCPRGCWTLLRGGRGGTTPLVASSCICGRPRIRDRETTCFFVGRETMLCKRTPTSCSITVNRSLLSLFDPSTVLIPSMNMMRSASSITTSPDTVRFQFF
ncbi:hypothetical protein PM082_015808 [Marasmius tenuissimus]|nr:hypothetical protein PM082_015808 [Marasmius tenuissimus]